MDRTSADNDKIKDRIRKLLNLAKDSAAYEGEIDNAMRFARRLMLEHNIAEGDLETPSDPHEAAAREEYMQAEAFTQSENFSTWEGILMSAVCLLIGTIGDYRTHQKATKKTPLGTVSFDEKGKPKVGTKVVFYGPAEDARDGAAIFEEWAHVIATMARLKFGGCFRGEGRSYAEGFAYALKKNMEAIQKEERKEIEYQSTSTALVLRNSLSLMEAKKKRGAEWLRKDQGIHLRHSSGRGNHNDPGAFAAGCADGAKSNFSRARTLKIGGG
jgi:hypothetical protein